MILSGAIFCNDPDWRLVVVKNLEDKIKLTFSGSWRPRQGYPFVDYRGSNQFLGDNRYRGPGLPEGAMLIRLGELPPIMTTNLPFEVPQEFVGNIYLACNDVPAPDCLSDNIDKLSYDILVEF